MSPSDSSMLADPWAEITYPLSVTELQRLSWLKLKITAVIHLDTVEHEQPVSFRHAKRLAFQRWRFMTGRLTEAAA